MKKIDLEQLRRFYFYLENNERFIKDAEAKRSCARSQNGIDKANQTIASCQAEIVRYRNQIAVILEQCDEAQKMLDTAKYEMAIVYYATGDYGRRESENHFIMVASMRDARATFDDLKKRNGGYVNAWVEIRPTGEFSEILDLREKIEKMQAELDKLLNGD